MLTLGQPDVRCRHLLQELLQGLLLHQGVPGKLLRCIAVHVHGSLALLGAEGCTLRLQGGDAARATGYAVPIVVGEPPSTAAAGWGGCLDVAHLLLLLGYEAIHQPQPCLELCMEPLRLLCNRLPQLLGELLSKRCVANAHGGRVEGHRGNSMALQLLAPLLLLAALWHGREMGCMATTRVVRLAHAA